MIRPSRHLSWKELACHDGARTPYPEKWRATRGRELGEMFEEFRALCGIGPLLILSGYRTPAHNASIGGAKKSQHKFGRAFDIQRPYAHNIGWMVKRAYVLMDHRPDLVGGVGIYPWGIHLDTRETARFVVWHGSRSVADIELPTELGRHA